MIITPLVKKFWNWYHTVAAGVSSSLFPPQYLIRFKIAHTAIMLPTTSQHQYSKFAKASDEQLKGYVIGITKCRTKILEKRFSRIRSIPWPLVFWVLLLQRITKKIWSSLRPHSLRIRLFYLYDQIQSTTLHSKSRIQPLK